jgi:EmrB/QacA subfamily drug resistance transporter
MSSRGPCDEAVLREGGAAPPCARNARSWVLAATVLGSSMAFVDGTVVNVSLPQIQARLGASGAGAQWIVEAYALLFSSLILVGGALGDRLGRRRVFVSGVGLFALASAACAAAGSVEALVAARAVQGIGAALLVPNSLAILGAAFPPAERGRAVGAWSAFTSAAMAIGPLLGGWLVQAISWRAACLINLPAAAAVVGIARAKVPETREVAARSLDVRGAVLVTLGLAGVISGLIASADRGGKDPRVVASLAAGALLLGAFVFAERRSPHPMVPPSLFRVRTFLAANLLTLFLYAALGAGLYFLAFDLIQAQGFTPAAAGAAVMPLIVFTFALSRWSGGLADRIGARRPLLFGPAIAAAGFALLAIPGSGATYSAGFLPGLSAIGLGLAVTVAPLTSVVLGSVPAADTGTASGVNNAVARVASLLAIAALGILFAAVFHRELDRRLASGDVSPATREHLRAESAKLGAVRPPAGAGETEARLVEQSVRSAVAAAFRVVTLACAALALLASACAAWGVGGGPDRESVRHRRRAAA